MWKQIEQLKGKKTILLTTHYLEEVDALADRVAIINEGNIVALDTPAQLKSNLKGNQRMIIKGRNIDAATISGIKNLYPEVVEIENGIEIISKKLNFDEIVDYLRSEGVKIEWLSMKEPTLDDVFLKLTGEEVKA